MASEHLATMDQRCIDAIRALSMDAVQQANSGRTDTAMAMAPVRAMTRRRTGSTSVSGLGRETRLQVKGHR